mmetsp:Transcript_103776/g.300172  ORF Transcript_103776/g.300172 Transcript_103776/m.300172 type:complete len:323 (-) Transcript_103776:485-1453(-)
MVAIDVHSVEQSRQLSLVVLGLSHLRGDHQLGVSLGDLHCLLDERGADHVQHRERHEHAVQEDGIGKPLANIVRQRPHGRGEVDVGNLEHGDERPRKCPIVPIDALACGEVVGRILKVRAHSLADQNSGDRLDREQQHERPEQGVPASGDGLNQEVPGVHQVATLGDPQASAQPSQAQDPDGHRVGGCQVEELHERPGQDENEVEPIPKRRHPLDVHSQHAQHQLHHVDSEEYGIHHLGNLVPIHRQGDRRLESQRVPELDARALCLEGHDAEVHKDHNRHHRIEPGGEHNPLQQAPPRSSTEGLHVLSHRPCRPCRADGRS